MYRAPRWAYPLMPAAAILAACAGCGSSAGGSAANPGGTAAAPVLGRPAGDFAHGSGFGTVKPTRVDNGGDPTGLVTHITWKSWGSGQAIGTGTSTWVGPNQAVAAGRPAKVTIEAFRLGKCHGKLAYRAVEWYFPEHGQSFSPHRYENICSGSFVPQQ